MKTKLSLLCMIVALGLTGATDALASVTSARTFALLVGSNRPGSGQAPLRYAHNDVSRLDQVLTELGDVDPGDIEILLDPGYRELSNALDGFQQILQRHARRDEKTVFVFYYTGHAKSSGLNLGMEDFSLEHLRRRLARMPASVRLVLLDACQSGEFSGIKGVSPAADFSTNSVMDLNVTGMAVIASSAGSELSQESSRLKGSFFSHHFTVALKGAADVDEDGIVTLSEAYRYAYHQTLISTARTAVGKQHVTLEMDLRGSGELPLTFPGRSSAALELPAALEGDILLTHRDSATVAADIRKVRGDVYRVSLQPGHYEAFVRLSPRRGLQCTIRIPPSGRVIFRTDRCEALELDDETPKGQEVIYSTARPVVVPRREWVALELGLGYFHGRSSSYVNRLADFGYHGLHDVHRFAGSMGILFSPIPWVSVGMSMGHLDRRKGHSNLAGVEQTVSWNGFRMGGFLRGNLLIGRRLFVPYVQFGGGLGRTTLQLSYSNSNGTDEATDVFRGGFVSFGGGLQVNPLRWFGITLFHLEYTDARVLEMTELLRDQHNNGGLSVMTGVRFAY